LNRLSAAKSIGRSWSNCSLNSTVLMDCSCIRHPFCRRICLGWKAHWWSTLGRSSPTLCQCTKGSSIGRELWGPRLAVNPSLASWWNTHWGTVRTKTRSATKTDWQRRWTIGVWWYVFDDVGNDERSKTSALPSSVKQRRIVVIQRLHRQHSVRTARQE
jgi:hypothetical protein